MASFEVIGFISNISYKQGCVLLFVDEYHKGYRKSDGTFVSEKCVSYKVIFKPYFKKYISEHFSVGMLVKVKGEVFPYAVEHGKVKDGISILGQTCDLYSYPRSYAKDELKMVRDCENDEDAVPDLDGFSRPDF